MEISTHASSINPAVDSDVSSCRITFKILIKLRNIISILKRKQ